MLLLWYLFLLGHSCWALTSMRNFQSGVREVGQVSLFQVKGTLCKSLHLVQMLHWQCQCHIQDVKICLTSELVCLDRVDGSARFSWMVKGWLLREGLPGPIPVFAFKTNKPTPVPASEWKVHPSCLILALRLAPGKTFQQGSAMAGLVLRVYFCLLLQDERWGGHLKLFSPSFHLRLNLCLISVILLLVTVLLSSSNLWDHNKIEQSSFWFWTLWIRDVCAHSQLTCYCHIAEFPQRSEGYHSLGWDT